MEERMHAPPIPALPALDSIERFPNLHAQVAESLSATRSQIGERLRGALPRTDILSTLTNSAASLSGAIVALEGVPGSGVTTILCQLAAMYPAAIWLPGSDAHQGLATLCAQLIALHDLPIALVPPNAASDAMSFERLLAEAATQRSSPDPLLLLVDDLSADDSPLSTLFAPNLPPGVVLIAGMRQGVGSALRPALRIALPEQATALLEQVAIQAGIPTEASHVHVTT